MLSSNTHITVIAPTKQLANTVKLACALCGLSSKEPITHYAIVNLPMADLHNARSGQSVKELANHPDASQTPTTLYPCSARSHAPTLGPNTRDLTLFCRVMAGTSTLRGPRSPL